MMTMLKRLISTLAVLPLVLVAPAAATEQPSTAAPKAAPPRAPAPDPVPGTSSLEWPVDDKGEFVPPPGSPQDQKLWKSMIEAQNGVTIQRAVATRLAFGLRQGRYEERLGDLARARPEDAKSIEGLRARLVLAWSTMNGIMATQWPVDPRLGCRYQSLELGSAMEAARDPSLPSELPRIRAQAQDCLDRQLLPLTRLTKANLDVQAAQAEADRVLAPAKVSPPAPADGAPVPPPAAAPAKKE